MGYMVSISWEYGIGNEKILGTTRISWGYDGIAGIANNFQDGSIFFATQKGSVLVPPRSIPIAGGTISGIST